MSILRVMHHLLTYPTKAVKGHSHQVDIDQCRVVIGEFTVGKRMPEIVEVVLEQQMIYGWSVRRILFSIKRRRCWRSSTHWHALLKIADT